MNYQTFLMKNSWVRSNASGEPVIQVMWGALYVEFEIVIHHSDNALNAGG